MQRRLIIALGAAAALALAACGSGYDGSSSGGADAGASAAATVTEADTDLGAVLVDADGHTLYGLTDDSEGVSTCDGSCAEAWPPLTVAGGELPPDLDPELFSVVQRADGSFQLKAGAWPLYRFAGDADPGDTNGQGSGGVWFAAAPDGSLVKTDAAAPQATSGGY